ncbi:MAG: thylakoid-associated protein, partial [Planctomycetes bacterium]|nr:thylakoid-associated protein [Planctomycetota bacterium]
MTGPAVSALHHTDYDRDAVLQAVRRSLEPLGGIGAFVPKGSRVVLKPNLVFGRGVDTAINT